MKTSLLCERRLQRVIGSKPLQDTKASPPKWQFSLSWRTWQPGYSESTRSYLRTTRVWRNALLASLLLASPPPNTTRDFTIHDDRLSSLKTWFFFTELQWWHLHCVTRIVIERPSQNIISDVFLKSVIEWNAFMTILISSQKYIPWRFLYRHRIHIMTINILSSLHILWCFFHHAMCAVTSQKHEPTWLI